ncbi:cytochrome c [Pseudooceanicola sp. CBS1P-1]|uniref:C-type cytochrome n=1 Tax=Pseudooceanicola albus TaxID=2692189 RepID=A0A6L7G796_9RHOB|nr:MULTISPECIES: cytochrome c [Pseudooceanicola]MBT9386165.1 cytochrome c [Pseudooceanicola endophyticus]MXN19418.1 c-type cytochrome [Pseudooceanicola albus]
MKTFLKIIAGLVVLGVLALLAFLFVPVQRSAPTETLAADWTPEPGRGEYVMRAGDCAACHTAEGGKPLAGGRAIESPMGTIWATNITPDKDTGIGTWSLDDFRAALVDGLTPDGEHLYPAMPYENYRFMSEQDIRALYDYLMTEVPAVRSDVEETRLDFPFNLRFGIRAWNWVALRGGIGFEPTAGDDLQARGQYLVEGPGHCAACHSPRNSFMAQAGTHAGEAGFLTGGVVGDWAAPALHGPESALKDWSVTELAAYLATGRNAHSAANGEMGLVIKDSTQYLSDQDNIAMAAFLKGLDGKVSDVPQSLSVALPQVLPPAKADDAGAETAKMLTEANPEMPLGARLYLDNCSACHFVTGKGAPGIFPELAGNTLVTSDQKTPLISVILHGASVPSTRERPEALVMQGYGERLDDSEVAALASFLRQAWGNAAPAVSEADVAAVRSAAPAH